MFRNGFGGVDFSRSGGAQFMQVTAWVNLSIGSR